MNEMHESDNLSSKFPRENPFKVPEGYFEHFTDRLNARIDAMEAEQTAPPTAVSSPEVPRSKVRVLWLHLRPALQVAAMVAVLYGLTYMLVQPRLQHAEEEKLAQSNVAEEYLLAEDEYEELLAEIRTEELYELLYDDSTY